MQHMPDAVDASKNLESSLENITINKEIVMNKLQKLQIKLNLCCFWYHWSYYFLGLLILMVWHSLYCTSQVQILSFWSSVLHIMISRNPMNVAMVYHKDQYLGPFFHTLHYSSQFTHFLTVTQSPIVCWWYPAVHLLPAWQLCWKHHSPVPTSYHYWLDDVKPSVNLSCKT